MTLPTLQTVPVKENFAQSVKHCHRNLSNFGLNAVSETVNKGFYVSPTGKNYKRPNQKSALASSNRIVGKGAPVQFLDSNHPLGVEMKMAINDSKSQNPKGTSLFPN